ncbi:hypothetical protein NC651_026124 [Populus alba x Populus x berolinensis]|nr:hypothetical protein NC651_026124 [Populus alba x Populus x berolinensis]
MTNPCSRPWKFHELFVKVSRFSSGLGNISFCHTFREANSICKTRGVCVWIAILFRIASGFSDGRSFKIFITRLKLRIASGFSACLWLIMSLSNNNKKQEMQCMCVWDV